MIKPRVSVIRMLFIVYSCRMDFIFTGLKQPH
jgi:hypothetical protein